MRKLAPRQLAALPAGESTYIAMNNSGLTHVLSHISVDGSLPLSLIEGHQFRAASKQEAEAIQKRLDAITLHGFPIRGIPYRHLVKEEHHPRRTSFHFEELPADKWKYWVIAFEGSNDLIRDLEHAAILLPVDLDLGMTLFFEQPQQQGDLFGWTGLPLHLIEKYYDTNSHNTNATPISVNDLVRIREHFERFRDLPPEAAFVSSALENFYSVRTIPKPSELRVVGYFAIIESLVTHVPRLTETLDSITHQIVSKMILLRKRFERPIPFDSHFLGASEDKIWKLLYSYRSCLAHGEAPDFKGKLQILQSHDHVVRFLKEIVKELIVLGSKEHVFLTDLKKC